MRYTKGPSGAVLNLTMPVPIQFEAPGYVQFKNTKFGDNKNKPSPAAQAQLPEIRLQNNLMVLRGTVEEPGELSPINVLLVHTPTTTRIINEVNYNNIADLATINDVANLPGSVQAFTQKIPIAGDAKYFDKVQCQMDKVGNDWGLLRFSGEVAGVLGMKKNRLAFTVHGGIVANDQAVGVEGVEVGGAKFSSMTDRRATSPAQPSCPNFRWTAA
jgi:hypothetical protein